MGKVCRERETRDLRLREFEDVPATQDGDSVDLGDGASNKDSWNFS